MRTVLHILTRREEALARDLAGHQRALPDVKVEVIDLTNEAPDYEALVEKLFAADSVEVF